MLLFTALEAVPMGGGEDDDDDDEEGERTEAGICNRPPFQTRPGKKYAGRTPHSDIHPAFADKSEGFAAHSDDDGGDSRILHDDDYALLTPHRRLTRLLTRRCEHARLRANTRTNARARAQVREHAYTSVKTHENERRRATNSKTREIA